MARLNSGVEFTSSSRGGLSETERISASFAAHRSVTALAKLVIGSLVAAEW